MRSPLRCMALAFGAPFLFMGCGGGETPGGKAKPTLAYVDPEGPGWRWVRDGGLSTPDRLVLALVAPGGEPAARGLAFTLATPVETTRWTEVRTGGSALVENGTFDVGAGQPLFRHLVEGGTLQAGIFQKGRGHASVLDGAAVRVAVALRDTAAPGTWSMGQATLKVLPATGSRLVETPVLGGTILVQ